MIDASASEMHRVTLQYFGVLDVGTPGKQFTGCFDTGSADAWLPLSSCTSQACQSHNTFSPDNSSTYSVSYGTQMVFATVVIYTFDVKLHLSHTGRRLLRHKSSLHYLAHKEYVSWIYVIIMQASSTQFSIQYATGAVYGNLAYDTVTLGGISIPNQALGVVRQAGKELLQSSCDGIIVRHG